MKKTALLLFIISTILVSAQEKYSTFYHQRVSLFEKLEVTSDDIIFLGNSITNGGEWSELFNNSNVKNRGISGDVCPGVLDRLEPITTGRPKKIFLLIGINCYAKGGSSASIITGIEKIIERIQTESPHTEIYLQSVLPVNDSFGMFEGHTKHWREIKPLNKNLETLAKVKKIEYIDLFSHFVEPGTEKLSTRYTNDGLHLMGEGYMKWVEIVEPYINSDQNIASQNFDFAIK